MTKFEEMLKRNDCSGNDIYYLVNTKNAIDVNITDYTNNLFSVNIRFSYLHNERMTFNIKNASNSQFTTTFDFIGSYEDFIEECENMIKEIKDCDSFIELISLLC